MKKNFLTIAAALGLTVALSGSAKAIPSLQVFIPGATYDVATETWVTTESNFTVWIVASEPVYGVSITASLGGADPYGGLITMGGTSYSGADFTSGLHPDLPPHGIFPTDWVDYGIGDLTTMTANTIADFNDGYEHGVTPLNHTGQIYMVDISITGFSEVHFDAWGYVDRGQQTDPLFVKAPFSHDGGTAVPEPATALLFALGAAGMGLRRKLRTKK